MLFKCVACDNYTLRRQCLKCGKGTVRVKPQAFSPKDKYGDLRRKAIYG